MKTESQDSVRLLFALPREEKIFDDFGCSLVDELSYHGRIYITENYICFNSNILGIKTKSVIPFAEISKIKKTNNTIEILTTNTKKPKQTFSSFTNTDITYKRIKMVCRNYLAKVNKKDNASISKKINPIIFSDSEKNNDNDNESDIDDHNISTGSGSGNDNVNKNQQNILSDNTVNDKTTSRTGSISISQKESESQSNNNNDNNNISEIDSVINFADIEDNQNIAVKHEIDLPIEDFFKKYYGNPSETQSSVKEFYASLHDHSNINIANWEKQENQCTPTTDVYTREMNFHVKIEGIPLVTQSDCTKNQTMTVFKENPQNPSLKYVIRGTAVTVGVPYSTYYTIEDQIEIYSHMNGMKTVLRIIYWNKLIKSTMFKSIILNSTKKIYPGEMENFMNFIRNHGDTIIPYVPVVTKKRKKQIDSQTFKLTHGIEKENRNLDSNKNDYQIWNKVKDVMKYHKDNKNIILVVCLITVILLLIIITFLEIRNNKLINTNIQLNQQIETLLLSINKRGKYTSNKMIEQSFM